MELCQSRSENQSLVSELSNVAPERLMNEARENQEAAKRSKAAYERCRAKMRRWRRHHVQQQQRIAELPALPERTSRRLAYGSSSSTNKRRRAEEFSQVCSQVGDKRTACQLMFDTVASRSSVRDTAKLDLSSPSSKRFTKGLATHYIRGKLRASQISDWNYR